MEKQEPKRVRAGNVTYVNFPAHERENPTMAALRRSSEPDKIEIAQLWEEGKYADAATLAQKTGDTGIRDAICTDGKSHLRRTLMGIRRRKVQDSTAMMYMGVVYKEISQFHSIAGNDNLSNKYISLSRKAWGKAALKNLQR